MVEFNLVLTHNMPRASSMYTSISVGIVYIFRIFKDSMKSAVLIHMLWVLVGIPNYPCLFLPDWRPVGLLVLFFLLCGIFRMWHVSILCFIYWRRQKYILYRKLEFETAEPYGTYEKPISDCHKGKKLKAAHNTLVKGYFVFFAWGYFSSWKKVILSYSYTFSWVIDFCADVCIFWSLP